MNTKRQTTSSIPFKKTFLICTEGTKTEPEYFEMLEKLFPNANIKCPRSKPSQNNPKAVLKQMEREIKEFGFQNTDQAWIVMDKNEWSEEQLNEPYQWSIKCKNFGFAVSNPNFEYWLLLHFEDGSDINSAKDVYSKLKIHIPNYNKSIDLRNFSIKKVEYAVQRAQEKDVPSCVEWPRSIGQTTVYKLVKQIIETSKQS